MEVALKVNLDELADELFERLNAQWSAKLRVFEARVAALEAETEAAWAEGDRQMAMRLNSEPRWRKTVDFFLDERIYRKTREMDEWRSACGTDGRLWKETKCLGWPRLWKVLLMSRRMRGDAPASGADGAERTQCGRARGK